MSNKVLEKIKSNKRIQYILFIVVFIILFVAIIFSVFSEKKETVDLDSVSNYIYNLENKLSDTLSKVEGVGKVSVVITVESGMETVLAMKTTVTENNSGKEIIETPIIVNGKTVVLKENYPVVTGVLIVAEGANNLSVLSKIQQATMSLLNININQIDILTMK